MVYENEVSSAEYNQIQQQTFGVKEIKYSRPKFVHRVLANLLDFIVFADTSLVHHRPQIAKLIAFVKHEQGALQVAFLQRSLANLVEG